MRYRIIMNDNGKFKVQRKPKWYYIGWESWFHHSSGWSFVTSEHRSGTEFDEVKDAVEALQAAKEFDRYQTNKVKWSVVLEEKQ